MRLSIVLVALWAVSDVRAEAWTIQTVAVRDLRVGQAIAAELADLGFDAYTEFVMSDGVQWVRVRVGCFFERADADGFAALLAGRYTRDAVVVPRTPGASTVPCLRREVGFVTPDAWRQTVPGAAAFEVEVAGVLGLVRYQGDRWQLLQEPATAALDVPASEDGPFEQASGLPVPFVHRAPDGGPIRLVCAGRLLATTPDAAIVEHEGVVSACRLDGVDGGAS